MELPKISIITPSFNQSQFLEETLRSVLDQRYPNLEYIVIDGGSVDGSTEIIKRFEKHLAYWVSEADRGQVHAINKGLSHITGDIFAFLNSDDVYLPGALLSVGEYFRANAECDWVCGDTLFFGEGHQTYLFEAEVPTSAAQALSWAAHAPQPGMFWRRKVLIQNIAGFDEKWRYCFDHDFYVRLLLAGHRCNHMPLPLAGYRLHTQSKTVRESRKFDEEFDRMAEYYEPRLKGRGKRQTTATRFLRLSYSSSQAGERREAAKWLLKALVTYPEGLGRRPFWGSLRRGLSNGGDNEKAHAIV
jgi:glycosyltransferase involved in cell wall biosynthesis